MKRSRVAFLLLLPASALAATKPAASLKATPNSITVGQGLQLTGTVTHAKAGATSVAILEQVGTSWQSLAATKLSAAHSFAVKLMLTAGTWHLVAQYKAGASTVHSKIVVVTVRAWTAVSTGEA